MRADNDNGPIPIPALTEQQQRQFWAMVDRSAGPDGCWPLAAANDNLVAAIKASPLSGRKAAAHFGVSYGMVANIRSGRRWAHVEAA